MNKKPSRIPAFVFGLLLGILCTIYLPKYVQPYLPEFMAGNETMLKGTVIVKEKKGETLLLTVSTPEGALLATFKQKVGEIDLLVKEKDEVQFTLPTYTPFIDDPKIIRVVKEQQAESAPAEVLAAPASPVNNTHENKSRHPVKLQAAAQSPGSAPEVKPQAAASASAGAMGTKPLDKGNSVPSVVNKKSAL